jgi:hypothetical protein
LLRANAGGAAVMVPGPLRTTKPFCSARAGRPSPFHINELVQPLRGGEAWSTVATLDEYVAVADLLAGLTVEQCPKPAMPRQLSPTDHDPNHRASCDPGAVDPGHCGPTIADSDVCRRTLRRRRPVNSPMVGHVA